MKSLELKAARVRCGISQQEMAKKLGISTAAYSYKENGKYPFTLEEVPAVAKILGLTMEQVNDYLFDSRLPNGNGD